jgi:hypothetical protein
MTDAPCLLGTFGDGFLRNAMHQYRRLNLSIRSVHFFCISHQNSTAARGDFQIYVFDQG